MQRSVRRLIWLVVFVLGLTLGAAILYQLGMGSLEGKPRTFWQALEWAGETLSTTGYGADSRWLHPLMVILVVAVQFVGVFIVFLIIPIYLVPFLEERFEEKVPRAADAKLDQHVIVWRYGPAVETLVQRLAASGVPTLVVETDEAQARVVMERNQAVVFNRSEEDALDVSRLDHARAIVANGRDQENAALILRARQMGFRREIYAFVEEPAHRKPMELAGATAAYTPRHIVAAALAAHASDSLSPRLPGIEELDGIERREVRVLPSSPLAGKTLRHARLGAIVAGVWNRSHLKTECNAETIIEPGTILELVGVPDVVTAAAARIGAPLLRNSGPYLVAGFGEVGRKVHQLLTDVDEEVRVLERNEGPDIDVVGDVLDSFVLQQARLGEARALVLALDSDDSTLFATVIARDVAPDVTVIARVNHARNLDNIHRAGADYALSISDISGEMLSARLLGRKVRARDEHRKVMRIAGESVAGRTAAQLSAQYGACWVLAAERDGKTLRGIDAKFVIDAADALWLCGTNESLAPLHRLA
ncbi:MAG TPA: NAD-binding protein [Thermoanaerobaculia bacterium]|nr:NAD-binding protein [Thermoanaerobaculia bacterium]